MKTLEPINKGNGHLGLGSIAAILNLPSLRRAETPSAQEVIHLCPGCNSEGREALGTFGRLVRASLRGETDASTLEMGLNSILSACPVTYHLTDAGIELIPVHEGDAGKLPVLRLALHVAEATRTGEWLRMKECAGCDCVFYDNSRNGKRVWCSMETCGNRAKVNRWRGKHTTSTVTAACGCATECTCGAQVLNRALGAPGGTQ